MGIDTQVHLVLATRWQRFLGQMIDGFFATAPLMLSPAIVRVFPSLGGVWGTAGLVWMLLYLGFGDGLHGGQSFAKQWLGTRVVDADTGAPCTWGDSFIRNIFTLLGPIDWIFIFGDNISGSATKPRAPRSSSPTSHWSTGSPVHRSFPQHLMS